MKINDYSKSVWWLLIPFPLSGIVISHLKHKRAEKSLKSVTGNILFFLSFLFFYVRPDFMPRVHPHHPHYPNLHHHDHFTDWSLTSSSCCLFISRVFSVNQRRYDSRNVRPQLPIHSFRHKEVHHRHSDWGHVIQCSFRKRVYEGNWWKLGGNGFFFWDCTQGNEKKLCIIKCCQTRKKSCQSRETTPGQSLPSGEINMSVNQHMTWCNRKINNDRVLNHWFPPLLLT